ncbi:hypothetical protein CPAR01_06912 [Colletotrichum paranaense]|uniref:Uncharacterized protein n=1 Tax=Colletotrichum paranaense TaxID=1914294 RepID=A0ABQ9SN88_9PEZI|nr:uncharacterized protein CPAR01_06912 [Colletotrichum paranaense]KAK1540923.1 hypothetical protein CPAR01_06912 [Colletotrichum paranaense]
MELYSLVQQDGHIPRLKYRTYDTLFQITIRRHLAGRYSNSSVLRPQIIEMIDERAGAFGAILIERALESRNSPGCVLNTNESRSNLVAPLSAPTITTLGGRVLEAGRPGTRKQLFAKVCAELVGNRRLLRLHLGTKAFRIEPCKQAPGRS